MKISVDGELLFEITEFQKKVFYNEIEPSEFEKEMKRRVFWVVNHKYEQCVERLKTAWAKDKREVGDSDIKITPSKLKERGLSIPLNDDDLINLIFSQSDYKDKETINIEERAAKEAAELERLATG